MITVISITSASPNFTDDSRAIGAVITPPTVCPVVAPVGRIESMAASRREITVLVAPVSSIKLPRTVPLSIADTIAERPANWTGTTLEPRGAVEADAFGIGTARTAVSRDNDWKNFSSFLE